MRGCDVVRIVNHAENIISTRQLKRYINLLPAGYRNCDVTIKLYLHQYQLKEDMKKWRKKDTLPSDYRIGYLGHTFGFYFDKENVIGILVHKLLELEYLDPHTNICSTLFHEFRHKQQHKLQPYRYKISHRNYDESWQEIDANEFSFKHLLEHCHYISQCYKNQKINSFNLFNTH